MSRRDHRREAIPGGPCNRLSIPNTQARKAIDAHADQARLSDQRGTRPELSTPSEIVSRVGSADHHHGPSFVSSEIDVVDLKGHHIVGQSLIQRVGSNRKHQPVAREPVQDGEHRWERSDTECDSSEYFGLQKPPTLLVPEHVSSLMSEHIPRIRSSFVNDQGQRAQRSCDPTRTDGHPIFIRNVGGRCHAPSQHERWVPGHHDQNGGLHQFWSYGWSNPGRASRNPTRRFRRRFDQIGVRQRWSVRPSSGPSPGITQTCPSCPGETIRDRC